MTEHKINANHVHLLMWTVLANPLGDSFTQTELDAIRSEHERLGIDPIFVLGRLASVMNAEMERVHGQETWREFVSETLEETRLFERSGILDPGPSEAGMFEER